MRLYDRLFTTENPGSDETRDWLLELNPASLTVVRAKGEPCLAQAKAGDRFQFERVGFFTADPDGKPGAPVFNRTVALKDAWAKADRQGRADEANGGPSLAARRDGRQEAGRCRPALAGGERARRRPRPHGRRGACPRPGRRAQRALRGRRRVARGQEAREADRLGPRQRSARRDAHEEARRGPVRRQGARRARRARPGGHDLDEAVEGRPRGDDRQRQARSRHRRLRRA